MFRQLVSHLRLRLTSGWVLGNVQVTCIKFTDNVVAHPLQWGEPLLLARNVSVISWQEPSPGLQGDDDASKDDCQVLHSGEVRFGAEESPESPPLLVASSEDSWFGTFHNMRLLFKLDVDVDLRLAFDESALGALNLGFNLLGLTSAPQDPSKPLIHRGFIADNVHLLSDCAGGVITVSTLRSTHVNTYCHQGSTRTPVFREPRSRLTELEHNLQLTFSHPLADKLMDTECRAFCG